MKQEQSPLTVSRRKFLVGLGASLTLPLLPGCGLIDQFKDPNCGALDCTSLPVLEVGTEFRDRVEGAAAFIRRLMHPDYHDFPILFQRSDSTHSGGLTQPGNTPLYSGPLVVRLFIPDTSEASATLAEKMVVHEAVHAFDISTGYKISNQLGREIDGNLTQEELSIIDESTYSTSPIQSNHGHPEANNQELLASTINVLRTYPDGFIEHVSRLPESSLIRLTNVASLCLNGLVDYAFEPVRVEDLPFDQNILDFIL